MNNTKKNVSTEKDTNLLDFQLKIKGVGKLVINFDARSRIERMFSKIIDDLTKELEVEVEEVRNERRK